MSAPAPSRPTIDLQGLFQDKQFNSLTAAQQRAALANVDPDFKDITDADYYEFRKRAGHPISDVYKPKEPTLGDKVISFLNPLVTGLATGAGASAGAPLGPVSSTIGGLSLGTAANMTMNRMRTTPEQSMLSAAFGQDPNSIGASLSNVVENELVGRALEKPMNMLWSGGRSLVKEIMNPGAVVGDIYKLNPTYSQYYTKTFGDKPPSKWVEDIFAAGAKARSMFNSQQAVKTEGTALAARISGKRPTTVTNPQYLADRIKKQAEMALDASYTESDAQAEAAKTIANANPHAFQVNPDEEQFPESLTSPGNPSGQQVQIGTRPILNTQGQPIIGVNGQPLTAPVHANVKVVTVNGPVKLDNTLQQAQNYLMERQKFYGDLSKASAEDQPIIAAFQTLLKKTNAKIDPATGNIIESNPVSFEDAWNTKKAIDQLSYSGDKTAYTRIAGQFAGISKSLNTDIDASIPQWKNDPGKKALKAWQNAKATVEQRHNVFGDDGVRQLINTTNSPISDIDKIIEDPMKLRRALTTSNLQMPSGKVASNNMQKDLKGYQVMKWMHDSWTPDPINPQQGSFNVQKITEQMNEPEMRDSLKQLFGPKDFNTIQEFFSNVGRVSQPMQKGGGLMSGKLWAMPGAIGISAGLLSGHITPYAVAGVGLTGFKLGGAAVGKLLTNPEVARGMVALSKGEPLGVSEQYFSRMLARTLQGTGVSLVDNNGKETPGTINEKGQFIPAGS